MAKLTTNNSIILDLIRGLSAQIVVVGHLLAMMNLQKHPKVPIIQNLGVLVFFVLSGFLITYSLSNKNESYTFKEFLIDRFSRIYIAFIPALVFVFVMDRMFSDLPEINAYSSESPFIDFVGNIVMLQNHPLVSAVSNSLPPFGSGRPFWTVAVEWWIYVYVGFIWLFLRKNQRATASTIVIFSFLSIVPIYNLIGRGDGLTIAWIFGAFLCWFRNRQPKLFTTPAGLYLVLFFCAIGWALRSFGTNSSDQYDIGLAFIITVSIYCLLELSDFKSFVMKIIMQAKKAVQIFADFSYSLYLIHYTVIIVVIGVLPENINTGAKILIPWLASNMIAYLFYYLTEYHTNRFKKILKQKFL